jgi:hypothetical protein
MSTPAPSSPLKYSDYLQGAAIVTGIIGASSFIGGFSNGVEITGISVLLTTIFAALSQWLQSKGD